MAHEFFDQEANYTENPSFQNFLQKYIIPHSAKEYFGFNNGSKITGFLSDIINGTLLDAPGSSSAFASQEASSDATRTEALDNLLTGNVDFNRTKEFMQEEQAFNAQEAEKQRQWYERMSNTAYQRAADDLKAAGYNPALLLNGASASSSAYGSSASVGSHSAGNSQLGAAMLIGNVANAITKVISSAMGLGYI